MAYEWIPSCLSRAGLCQVSSNVSWAAALGYLSLLLGTHLPHTAVLAEVAANGDLLGPCLERGALTAARKAGIKTILVDRKQVGFNRDPLRAIFTAS